jgi:hypothetical protein
MAIDPASIGDNIQMLYRGQYEIIQRIDALVQEDTHRRLEIRNAVLAEFGKVSGESGGVRDIWLIRHAGGTVST